MTKFSKDYFDRLLMLLLLFPTDQSPSSKYAACATLSYCAVNNNKKRLKFDIHFCTLLNNNIGKMRIACMHKSHPSQSASYYYTRPSKTEIDPLFPFKKK